MSDLNRTFCGCYYKEVKKDFLKILPIGSIKGILAAKMSDQYEVYIPKNQWLPKGLLYYYKAEYATEAKGKALGYLIDRIASNQLDDSRCPIVLKPIIKE